MRKLLFGFAILALLIALAAIPAKGVAYHGQLIDGRVLRANFCSSDGCQPGLVAFKGFEARASLFNGEHILIELNDSNITDFHNILGRPSGDKTWRIELIDDPAFYSSGDVFSHWGPTSDFGVKGPKRMRSHSP